MTTNDPTPRILFVMFIASIVTASGLLHLGCQTAPRNGIKQDDFPAGVPCVQARNDAAERYRQVFRAEPRIPAVKVVITETPPDGDGGNCRGSGDGYVIRLWRGQNPFYGSLVHEFKHALWHNNGKGWTENL